MSAPAIRSLKGKPLVRIDPTQLQSNQEAQWAATQASINDVQNARNAVNSAQQSLIVAESSVAAARQQVVAFQTNVDRAEVDLKTAQRELKRYTDLIESGVASRFEYDAARDKFDQAKIALKPRRPISKLRRSRSRKRPNERTNRELLSRKHRPTSSRQRCARINSRHF